MYEIFIDAKEVLELYCDILYNLIIIVINMNSKYCIQDNSNIYGNKKPRSSKSQTPNRGYSSSKANPIQLSQYFSKRNTNPCNDKQSLQQQIIAKNNQISLLYGKQNIHSNANIDIKRQSKHSNEYIMRPSQSPYPKHHQDFSAKQATNQKNNAKKVIKIKSNLKNSHSKRQELSFSEFSTEKRRNTEFIHTQDVGAFEPGQGHQNLQTYGSCNQLPIYNQHHSDKFQHKKKTPHTQWAENKKPVIIELDLYKHRKSLYDTLTSSSGIHKIQPSSTKINFEKGVQNSSDKANSQINKSKQQHYCSNISHFTIQKPATFMIKGIPYCDKCAATFITSGQLAVRINNIESNKKDTDLLGNRKQEEERTELLKTFIEKLDSVEPQFEFFQQQLEAKALNKIKNGYKQCYQDLDKWLEVSMKTLNQKHRQLRQQLFQSEKRTHGYLKELKIKLEEQIEDIKFMRNDIIQNISSIVKPEIVNRHKFERVYQKFEQEFLNISQTYSDLNQLQIIMPELKNWNQLMFNQLLGNLDLKISPESQEANYVFFSQSSQKKKRKEIVEDDCNPYRLSFGKELGQNNNQMQSPTFKAI